ncbi:MAG: hypothetical protein LIP04_11090 [Tannerellaceae bacterium]|nr:hypothetical protein [Tannerellaceae bacterium]MCD7711171.1 hypothetical protein [Bacillota bacterium]
MPIIIKEIRVKTTVGKRPDEIHLSREVMEALKRSILKEFKDIKYTQGSQTAKDR